MAQREVVVVHQVCQQRVLTRLIVVKTKICILIVEVVVGNKSDTWAHLLFGLLVVDSSSHGRADLDIGVGVLVENIRSVDLLLPERVAHISFIVDIATQTLVAGILCTPTHLHALLGLVEPAVSYIYLVRARHIPHSILVAIVTLGIHRAVCEDYGREALIFGYGDCRREVNLGLKFIVKVDIQEEALLIGRLAVLEVNLTRHRLVARRNRGDSLRHLDRVEPHTRRIAQAIGRAQSAHNGAILIENLRISTRKAEHLNLSRARDCIAITHRHRCRVFERLCQVTARHLTKTSERNHLILYDSALHNVVTASAGDHYALHLDTLAQAELHTRGRIIDPQRIVRIADKRGNQTIITLHAVELKLALEIGARTNVGIGPIESRSGQRPTVTAHNYAGNILRSSKLHSQNCTHRCNYIFQIFHFDFLVDSTQF